MKLLPRSLGGQLMLLTAFCLVTSILGYGAFVAKQQTDSARFAVQSQLTAEAKNLASASKFFMEQQDIASVTEMALQTAVVPGVYSILVTNRKGVPLSEIVNSDGRWSPRFSLNAVKLPVKPIGQLVFRESTQLSTQHDFLAGSGGRLEAWQPIGELGWLGWVRVSYRLDTFDKIARDIWLNALVVIVISIVTTLLLLSWLLRSRIEGLRRATSFASDLDHLQGIQMPVSPVAAEIADLGTALNVVSARLFAQNIDLNNQKFALDQHAIVSISDLNGTITYANGRFCEVSGYNLDELLGRNHRILNSGHHPAEMFVDMWQTISSGKVWRGELKNRHKEGSHYWVSATIVPLMGSDGLPQQYIGIRTDITANKALAQSLQEAKTAADSANSAKSEFLANMSHEIRTPMNGVIGMTELALDMALDPIQRGYLNTVKSSANALLVILNDILDFSKIEAGKMEIENIAFNPRQTIVDALKAVEMRAVKKGLSMTCNWPENLPTYLTGDPGRIRQVLTNLCDNAIKFTEHGGINIVVAVRAFDLNSLVMQVSVTDTGVGIAASKQKVIFAPFSQVDSSTTRRFGGTGLGLTISTHLVELMGGRIWVESVEGVGSTFHFTTRLGRLADEAVAAPGDLAIASDARPLRILLVEDHAINQLLVTTLLKKWGHAVTLATDGQEAVNLFPTEEWDLVLMDMQMPVLGGLEATAIIREREPTGRNTPIIAITANAMESDRESCLRAGMDDFLSKPISAPTLRTMIAKHCHISTLQH